MFATGSQRRRITAIAIAIAALTVSVGATAYGRAHAAPIQLFRLELAANALKPAVRLSQAGVIMFPMNPVPRCSMSRSSFGQPRSGGRLHEGLDIMASLGQEVYAVANGVLIRQSIDGAANATLSGNAWTLQLADRTEYFYGHLSRFADGLALGATVTRGQLIGYVGDTGNAGPGNYHLHFGVFPKGGPAVDPLPLLTVPKACTIFA